MQQESLNSSRASAAGLQALFDSVERRAAASAAAANAANMAVIVKDFPVVAGAASPPEPPSPRPAFLSLSERLPSRRR